MVSECMKQDAVERVTVERTMAERALGFATGENNETCRIFEP
jgi:hypothetical protein